MRNGLVAIWLLLGSVGSAVAQVSVGISVPGVNIGINMPVYPQLVPVPGYPVYYAPQANANYFFYDGLYWVYQQDNWYASSWYNGPWSPVSPEAVPLFVLRVPVRYYRQPPVYFRGWQYDAPPRWGDHWGHTWAERRHGWDRWDRHSVYRPAPLPSYQRQYSGDRYPHADRQREIQGQRYHYQPRDAAVQQHFQPQRAQPQRAPDQRHEPVVRDRPAPDQRHEPVVRSRPAPDQRHEPAVARPAPVPRQEPAAIARPAPVPRQEPAVRGRPAPDQRQEPAVRSRPAPDQRHEPAGRPAVQQNWPGSDQRRERPGGGEHK